MIKRASYLEAHLLGLLLALGVFIRVCNLGDYYWSPDDLLTLLTARAEDLAGLWYTNLHHTHPPGKHLLLRAILAFSDHPLHFRLIGIIPGIAAIVALHLLGKRLVGVAGGLATAAVTAFGFGNVLTSQVPRSYSLFLFVSVAALISIFSHWEKGGRRWLIAFMALSTLAVGLHYSAFIFLTAVGLTWLAKNLAARTPPRRYADFFIGHLPALALSGVLIVFHALPVVTSGHYRGRTSGYLSQYFPTSVLDLAGDLEGLFGYLFLPPVAVPIMLMSVVGMVVLWKRGRWEPVAMFGIAFGLNLALALAGKYPLGGTRQCLYLFPFLALFVGATAQAAVDALGALGAGRYRAWGLRTMAAGFALGSILVTWHYSQSDFLRRYAQKSVGEFPILASNYARMNNKLNQIAGPDAAVLTNLKSSLYVMWDGGAEYHRNWRQIYPYPEDAPPTKESFYSISLKGLERRFPRRWTFHGDEDFWRVLALHERSGALEGKSRVLLVEIGGSPMIPFLRGPRYRLLVRKVHRFGNCRIYVLDARIIKRELSVRRIRAEKTKPPPSRQPTHR